MNTFARIPDRFVDLLRLGEITFDQFGLMVVLVRMADYTTRTATFASIEALRHDLGWARRGQERDEKTLRNALHRLRELGEIDYESQQGQRRGWAIRIAKDDYYGSRRGPSSEVTSDGSRSRRRRDADEETGSGRREPRTDAARYPADTDTDIDAASDIDIETEQSSNEEVPALIDRSLTEGNVNRLVALLDPEDVASNTRGVIAELVSALRPHRLEEVIASFRAAQSRGEVRNTAKYLVAILQGMTRPR